MEKVDLSEFYKETDTPETRAYEHALEIEHIVAEEMLKQNISKTELAQRMGISVQRLSKLLNTQPNMTLTSIAKLEIALGIDILFKEPIHATIDISYEAPRGPKEDWSGHKNPKAANRIEQSRANYEIINGGLAA